MSTEPQWYYYHDRTQDGPLAQSVLARRINARVVPLSALVWSSDHSTDDWRPAREVPAFARAAEAPPAPMPVAVPVPVRVVAPRAPLPVRPAAPPVRGPGSLRPRPVPRYSQANARKYAIPTQHLPVGVVYAGPWERFWARLFDLLVPANLLLSYTVEPLFSALQGIDSLARQPLLIFTWMLVEPLVILLFGNTPGKWLFGLALRMAGGRKQGLIALYRRCFSVYVYGLGLGLVFFMLFGLASGYSRLNDVGSTSWDENTGLYVVRDRSGLLGWSLLILAGLGLLLFLSIKSR